MEKVLIVSFFYPPCNLTANQRVHNWAKELHKYGFYPIIVTRNWDKPIHKSEDVLVATGKKLEITRFENYEVHYLPYKAGLRDRIYTNTKSSTLKKVSKLFTFFDLFFENWFIRAIPHRNLYYYSEQLLKNDPTLKKLVISANPFNLFFFGYKLQKKGIQWIADYRDDWSTSELKQNTNLVHQFISTIQKRSEKKWLKNASYVTSVSDHYTKKIAKFVSVDGHTLLNGFDQEYFEKYQNSAIAQNSNNFKIVYNGSLYASQPIELFIDAVKEVLLLEPNINLEIHFPGLAFDKKQEQRVRLYSHEIEKHVFITDRIPKEQVIELQCSANLLLLVGHKGLKGIPSSKLYEYLALHKPILYYPNDHDIVEETLEKTKTGFLATTKNELVTLLIELINSNAKILAIDKKEIAKYSAQNQVGKLADLLKLLP